MSKVVKLVINMPTTQEKPKVIKELPKLLKKIKKIIPKVEFRIK